MEDKELEVQNNNQTKDGSNDSSLRSLRGLYGKAKISVKTLNIVITVGIIAIVVLVIFGVSTNGYNVEFNTMGGTYIEPRKMYYNDQIEVDNPTREGFEFDHWALDEACGITANLDTLRVDSNVTLYACWKDK